MRQDTLRCGLVSLISAALVGAGCSSADIGEPEPAQAREKSERPNGAGSGMGGDATHPWDARVPGDGGTAAGGSPGTGGSATGGGMSGGTGGSSTGGGDGSGGTGGTGGSSTGGRDGSGGIGGTGGSAGGSSGGTGGSPAGGGGGSGGQGATCDQDSDMDGTPDCDDTCPHSFNPAQGAHLDPPEEGTVCAVRAVHVDAGTELFSHRQEGIHWEERAENYVEVGWRVARAIDERGYLEDDDPTVLKVFLLAGQSNMAGKGVSFAQDLSDDSVGTALETVVSDASYRATLDPGVYTFLSSASPAWLNPRNDVWGIHYNSGTLQVRRVIYDKNGSWTMDVTPLVPGLGDQEYLVSRVGIEMGMGQYLGAVSRSPLFLFKSDRGGSSLRTDWRSPSMVDKRGGEVGVDYVNTIDEFVGFVNALDPADYGATQVRVAGFVWLQGWSDRGQGSLGALEYEANMVDLANDVRAALGKPQLPVLLVDHPQVDRIVAPNGSLSGADGVISQAKIDAAHRLQ